MNLIRWPSRCTITWFFAVTLASVMMAAMAVSRSNAAVEIEGWGDLRGFRIDGELIHVTTSLRGYWQTGSQVAYSGHWQQRNIRHTRDGDKQIYEARISTRDENSITYHYAIQGTGENGATIEVQTTPSADMKLDRLAFRFAAPFEDYGAAAVELIDPVMPTTRSSEITNASPAKNRRYLNGVASGVRFTGARRHLQIDFDQPRHVVVMDLPDSKGDQVYAEIQFHDGALNKGETAEASFTIHAGGEIDHEPAHLLMKPTGDGRPFEGIGGNLVFGLDAPVTAFNLQHFRIVWARMAVPLVVWEPQEVADPTSGELAANDKPGSDIRNSLQMAKKLSAQGTPLIFSLWVAPPWALNNPDAHDPYAFRRIVKPEKWDALARAIGSYLLYAKQQYGVEPSLFSFNESDLGVTIKLTPQQHRDAIKQLGACFAEMGLKTKLLLGDVSFPGPVNFIGPTASDPQAMQYVGAISYHSWNGATPKELAAWHTAATAANLPLLVVEGGTDSDAYRYPFVLSELWYAMDEGAYYLDVLSQSQPLTVMPWELTTDYPLAVMEGSELVPSKRFWFLKQLTGTTAPGAIHQELAGDHAAVHAAAFSDPGGNEYSIQIINNGASRDVTVGGIPAGITQLNCYITDAGQSFAKLPAVAVEDGSVHLQLPAMCFVSLTNRQVAEREMN